MRLLSKKILCWYMREREMQHLFSRTTGNISKDRLDEIEKQKRHMRDASVKIHRKQED